MRKHFEKISKGNCRGSNGGYSRQRCRLNTEEIEETSSKESMGLWAKKNWSDRGAAINYRPIMRFLESAVGRPWDEVYAEICSSLLAKNYVTNELKNYIKDSVEINTFLNEDGKVYYNAKHGYGHYIDLKTKLNAVRPIEDSFNSVYVCPETKILKRIPKKKYRIKTVKEKTLHNINETQVCIKIQGIWYLVELEKSPEPVFKKYSGAKGYWYETPVHDVVLHGYSTKSERARLYGKSGYYGVSKKQLSHRELKKYKLFND